MHEHCWSRREFLRRSSLGALAALALPSGCRMPGSGAETAPPAYLRGYETLFARDPRAAARAWFKEARFGLFMHFGLYSLLGRGEWVMYHEKIPVAEYRKRIRDFHPDKFDADFITDLALDAEMKYVNLTARHHDGFCLFATETDDFNAARSPAHRDLVGELAEECRKKGLGLFLYYSIAADWHHPWFYPRTYNPIARPAYPEPDPAYRFEKDEDFEKYLADARTQLEELLSHYGPLAGIWFDPLMGYYGRPDLFPMEAIYAQVRGLQPQVLISFKQGVTGTEDFAAPEHSVRSLAERIRKRYGEKAAEIAARAWERNKGKHNEICTTLQDRGWGYVKGARHKGLDEVMKMLADALRRDCNLLLNTGPLPDGSIHPEDVKTLRAVGRRIRAEGWPGA